MIPLTVTAELTTPPIVDRPVMLDGLLWAAVAERAGRAEPSGWAEMPDERDLPLSRVDGGDAWWWAASAVTPWGPEQAMHVHRRPEVHLVARWTDGKSIGIGNGPDKALRTPKYARPAMMRIVWTCIGDAAEISSLLRHIGGIGQLRGHGHGWVRSWRVEPGGPPAAAYATDPRLRHLPASVDVPHGASVTRRTLPLRPPYHARRNAIPCWQVPE